MGRSPRAFARCSARIKRPKDPTRGSFKRAPWGFASRISLRARPVTLTHLHPAHPTLTFAAPARPSFAWRFDDAITPADARLHHLVVEPETLRVSCTYVTELALPRTVIPGIHAHIPLALRVDDRWCPYEAPKTVVASMREAGLDPLSVFRS
jgi:hypothetical protein